MCYACLRLCLWVIVQRDILLLFPVLLAHWYRPFLCIPLCLVCSVCDRRGRRELAAARTCVPRPVNALYLERWCFSPWLIRVLQTQFPLPISCVSVAQGCLCPIDACSYKIFISVDRAVISLTRACPPKEANADQILRLYIAFLCQKISDGDGNTCHHDCKQQPVEPLYSPRVGRCCLSRIAALGYSQSLNRCHTCRVRLRKRRNPA